MRNCFTALLFLSIACYAHACPSKNGVVDVNSDGDVRVVVLGDSIPLGLGDKANGDRGGYVLRASRRLPAVTFTNASVRGYFAAQVGTQVRQAFRDGSTSPLKDALLNADIVIIDVGRNDRWLFGDPLTTYRTIRRTSSLIQRYVEERGEVAPIVVTAVLMLPNRGAQGPWVKELNNYLLHGGTASRPTDLRFDLVSKRLLGTDQIHPTSQGYAALATVFVNYLKKKLPSKFRALYPDGDADTLPDEFETSRFGTSAELADTDGDGKTDGDEVCTVHTDPVTPD